MLASGLSAGVAACVTTDQGAPLRAPVGRIVSDADVEALIPIISNWGRWGETDQIGTLNLLTPERRAAAAALVRTGRTFSLARRISLAPGGRVERAAHEVTLRPQGSRDYVGMVFHGFEVTHLDALCHAWADGRRMYNGWPSAAVTAGGAAELGIEHVATGGIVGRGVLLDLGALELRPGDAVTRSHLEATEAAQRVRLGPGDMLLVRTGLGRSNVRERRAGLHPECLPWLRERDIALLMSDGDSDAAPIQGFDRFASAMHSVAVPHLGLALVDNADLDALAAACRAERRWTFFLSIAPLALVGATGSPVNPLAIF